MKLAVVCANGKAGLRIVEEAVSRGLDVTAVVRGENRSAARAVRSPVTRSSSVQSKIWQILISLSISG